jgi:2-oxoglutarate dehydrogenase complex dehydrogenase (E1) component-like enzyme
MTKTQAINKINEATATLGKLNKGQHELLNAIINAFETTARAKVIETDEGTMVWCNYHNQYEPVELFDTRVNKHGKEVYRSSCKDGMKATQLQRRLKNKVSIAAVKAFKLNEITADDMATILADVETASIEELKDILSNLQNLVVIGEA